MIREIEVQNYKCYEHLRINDCARLNVIVGANGIGKTALLESIFLPLSSGTEAAARLRIQRGLDVPLGGTRSRIERGLWGDFFFNNDTSRSILLSLSGDGPESRKLSIARVRSQTQLKFGGKEPTFIEGPVLFQWTDAIGGIHPAIPQVGPAGMQLPDTGEALPYFFHFPATQMVGSTEIATNFSELISNGGEQRFIEAFSKEYPIIEDIKIHVHAGSPVLFATLKDTKARVALPNLSGGINRTMAIQLAIASRPTSVMTIDEIENGIYYRSMPEV